jgi:hypothetical protein
VSAGNGTATGVTLYGRPKVRTTTTVQGTIPATIG